MRFENKKEKLTDSGNNDTTEKKSLVKKEETSLINDGLENGKKERVFFSFDGAEEYKSDRKDKKEVKETKAEYTKLVCGFVIIFALLGSVALGCFAFAVVSERQTENTPSTDEVMGDDESGSKVVFVKPYDDESGVLCASEIYERSAKSVVSVLCSFSGKSGAARGIGSGFIISEDGYIATAAHVVGGADGISVVFADKKMYEARLVSADQTSDIALLKINAKGLSPLIFGKSGDLLVGERVYAIGTPAAIEYAGTLTSGEVSYVNRIVPIYNSSGELEKKLSLIQTNTEVNPGNSGCPLFDEYGRVVGIVTMKLGSDISGIGFAIPSDGAVKILEKMKTGEKLDSDTLSGVVISAPKLGVVGESAQVNGIYGIEIEGFADNGSTAERALKVGDLIVEIDGVIVTRESDIAKALQSKNPRDSVCVSVIRSGQRLSFDIVLGA